MTTSPTPSEAERLASNLEHEWTSVADMLKAAAALRQQQTEIEAMRETLEFVERWAVHHASKPHMTAELALGSIQHHPEIRAITERYSDGKRPDTFDPYARIAEMEEKLVAEARATAEHKLRADQLAQQHRMQAQMHAQATQQLAELEASKNASIHKLEMDALDLASENSILKRQEQAELEACKPLPLSYRSGVMASSVDGGAMVSLHFTDMAEAEAWFVEITDQYDAALVDKSPNLQEPLVDKTAKLQDRPAPLSNDERLRLRSDVARAIWDVMREHEDRCGHALEDVEPKHQVWDCADAAIETALGIIPRPNPLIARREVVAGGPVRVTRLHLTDEGRAALTSKATGPLPPARVEELMADAGYLGASAESRADFINGIRHGEVAHGITGGLS